MMQKTNLLKILGGALCAVVLASGCASRQTAWEKSEAVASLAPAQKTQYLNEAKKLWSTRQNRSDLESALTKFKAVAESDPSDYDTMVYLARGYYLLADAHLEDIEEKKKNWEISVSWGEKAMITHPEFKSAVADRKESVTDSVQFLTKKQIDALYWSAASLGKWAKNSGLTTTLKYKSQIKRMIERVGELNSDYFYGAVYRYWGVYYAVAPGFAGGSMEKSLENFQKSFKVANNYLGTHILYAENYAAKQGDKELFKKELDFVLKSKADIIPELTPEQILEKKKAEKMLANMETYF